MAIIWDDAKRRKTLTERSLDFADAAVVFAGRTVTLPDERRDYGAARYMTAGWLRGRFVIIAWTLREDDRRIISMRYGHADEEIYYQDQMD